MLFILRLEEVLGAILHPPIDYGFKAALERELNLSICVSCHVNWFCCPEKMKSIVVCLVVLLRILANKMKLDAVPYELFQHQCVADVEPLLETDES